MVRTQIQLPDDVYARARQLCKSREISMAELARRGLEYILNVYSLDPALGTEWDLPKPRRLGWKGTTDAELKLLAQLSSAESSLAPRRKR